MHTINGLNQVAALNIQRNYTYRSYGMLWKFGVGIKASILKPVLTLTNPWINFASTGTILFEDYLSNTQASGSGDLNDVYVSNAQENSS
jgi:hypothetical protein